MLSYDINPLTSWQSNFFQSEWKLPNLPLIPMSMTIVIFSEFY